MVRTIVFYHNVSPEKACLSFWKKTLRASVWDALARCEAVYKEVIASAQFFTACIPMMLQ
jgi:hypothetical protein